SRRPGVDRSDDQDLRAVRDALIGLRLLLLRVALRIHDAGGNACGLERLDERRRVEQLPANRCLGVRHETADLNTGGLLAGGRSPARDHPEGEDGDTADNRRQPSELLHPCSPPSRTRDTDQVSPGWTASLPSRGNSSSPTTLSGRGRAILLH